jgi:Rps23 Pro-64 3,4-dihydroxylase Tpa1-like proline 4-hydroxylase
MINQTVLNSANFFKSSYSCAYPFPYIVIDNFLHGEVARKIATELKSYQYWSQDTTETVKDYQVNKFYTPDVFDLETLKYLQRDCPITKFTLDYLNDSTTLKFLENLTGIPELSGDETFLGGGVHKVTTGGKLGIHADFNIQFKNNLHRRLNMLIYLNEYWKEDWGGNLELWEKDMSKCCVQVPPLFNRAVIFRITDDAFHGHPHPLNTPKEVDRLSLALYYYTKDRPENEKAPFHPVVWKTPR